MVSSLLLSNSKSWWHLGMLKELNLIQRGSTTLRQQCLFPTIRKTSALRGSRLVLHIFPSRLFDLLESNLKHWRVLMMLFLLKIMMLSFTVPKKNFFFFCDNVVGCPLYISPWLSYLKINTILIINKIFHSNKKLTFFSLYSVLKDTLRKYNRLYTEEQK